MSTSIRTFAVALLTVALSMAGPAMTLADTCPEGQTAVIDAAGATTCVATSVTAPSASPGTTTTVSGTSASTTVSSTGTISVTETTVTATTSTGSVTTDGTTTTLSAPTVTATTTGTTATASVPTTTVTVDGVSGGSSPDLSTPSTGSGSATATQTVTPSGTGLDQGQSATTSLTDEKSPATLMASDGTRIDEGIGASVRANEPVSGTKLSGSAGARALLCLLAEASGNPTSAALSSLCKGAPSTAGGDVGFDLASAPTGTHVTTGAALRAAICLLGLVSSPLPSGSTTDDKGNTKVASASLSMLCVSGPLDESKDPSTVDGTGDLHTRSDRTGTDVDAAPMVAVATCLLANGTVGDPTVAHLSSLCATASGGGGSPTPTPSTIDASAPTTFSDTTTDTGGDLAPAASAATCILLDALAQVHESSEPAAAASLSTACGSTSGGTTPSDGNTPTPSTIETPIPAIISTPGPDIDIAPAVKAAVCILTNAQASTGGASLAVTDACAGTGPAPQGPTSGPGPTTTPTEPAAPTTPTEPAAPTTPEAPSTVAGVQFPPSVGGPVAGVAPVIEPAPVAPAGVPADIGQTGQLGEATAPAAGLAGLPSTSTVAITGGLIAALLATMAALGRRRRS